MQSTSFVLTVNLNIISQQACLGNQIYRETD